MTEITPIKEILLQILNHKENSINKYFDTK